MNDIKKVLIVAICVVLVIAIAAGVSIGVMANTMNGLKDRVEELDQAYASDVAAMKAEIEAAKAANENLVTAADFEAKLAAAIGEQNQTMQSLISTAVKNQIEDLEVEGLTEEQVNEIIDAAVANCLTEADIDAIIADIDTGLTKDEVKKLITNNTAGYLTYAQIANMIDDADYDLRAYLEKTLTEDMITLVKELEAKLGKDLSDVKGELEGNIKDLEENVTKKGVAKIGDTYYDSLYDLTELSGALVIDLVDDVEIKTDGGKALYFKNATSVTINGNDYTITMNGTSPYSSTKNENVASIIVENGAVIVNDVTIVNDKYCGQHSAPTKNCAGRNTVYTFVDGTSVTYNNVNFDGGVVTYCDTVFNNCEFEVEYEWHFALFVDNEYGDNSSKVVLDGCNFTANGSHGCVKVADDELTGVELTIKDCEFDCADLQYAVQTWNAGLPAADVKVTGKVAVITEGTNDFTYGIVANKDNGGATLNGETMTVKTLY